MNEKNKTKIIVAVIGLIGTIVGAIGGNAYSNTLRFNTSGNIIYVLNGEYSLMKFTISICETAVIDKEGIITIKADDDIVYTSPSLNKKTEAYTKIDVPINNCKLLTIEYSTNSWDNDCIMSDIVVYNE